MGFRQEQGQRPYQEDELLISPSVVSSAEVRPEFQTHLFGVFDGHAGGWMSAVSPSHYSLRYR